MHDQTYGFGYLVQKGLLILAGVLIGETDMMRQTVLSSFIHISIWTIATSLYKESRFCISPIADKKHKL